MVSDLFNGVHTALLNKSVSIIPKAPSPKKLLGAGAGDKNR